MTLAARSLIATVLVITTTGCMTVQPVHDPARFILAKQPKLLWVTRTDGNAFLLANPRVDDRDVVGNWRGGHDEEMRVPLADAQLVEARQINRMRTVLVSGVVGVTAGLAILWIAKGGAPATPCNNPYRYDITSCN